MKGITPVIAIILLLLITISMVGFAFVWFQRVQATATGNIDEQLGNQLNQSSKSIRIDSVSGSAVVIRNTGTSTIAGNTMSVYVNGALQTCNPAMSAIPPGSVGSCSGLTTGCPNGAVRVRATSPGGFDETIC